MGTESLRRYERRDFYWYQVWIVVKEIVQSLESLITVTFQTLDYFFNDYPDLKAQHLFKPDSLSAADLDFVVATA